MHGAIIVAGHGAEGLEGGATLMNFAEEPNTAVFEGTHLRFTDGTLSMAPSRRHPTSSRTTPATTRRGGEPFGLSSPDPARL